MELENKLSSTAFDDKELAEKIKLGNQLAFAVIYDRYHKQVYALAKRYLKSKEIAEDAVQDIFVNLWTNRFRIEGSLNFKSYLFTSAKNYILNVIRSNQKAVESNYEFLLDYEFEKSGKSQLDESYEMTSLIEKAVETLSPQRKTIFYLKTDKSLSNKEISEKLNISVNTVKVQYYHILKEIRNYMSKNMTSSVILISMLFR